MSHVCSPIFVVSKPLGPPWTDGSKNLTRDLATVLAQDRDVHAFAAPGAPGLAPVRPHPMPTATLSRRTSLAMAATLGVERETALWHFLFAPSARTATVARALTRLRARPSVQTLASAPADGVRLGDVVFADRVVALSHATHTRALEEGVSPARLRRVPVAITAPQTPSPERIAQLVREHALTDRFVVTFPGDLEHGGGARALVDAVGVMAARRDVTLVLACRDKTPRSAARREELAVRARGAGVDLRLIGETPYIHALLAASNVVALPTRSLFAKVDHPLVLLEAMHLGVPVLVSEGTAAFELSEEGGALGAAMSPDALAASLDGLAADAEARVRASRRALALVHARTPQAMARAYESIYDELLR